MAKSDVRTAGQIVGVDAPTQNVTPRIPEWRENVIRTVAVITLIYATYWILWRWTHTINTTPRGIVPSLVLLVAETWAYLNMGMFVFLVWRLKERDPGPAPEGRTVDVFITNYDEPLEVLRRTAIGARAIRYPHRTYMLDDGKRDEVRAMAEELGIGYIRRAGNANAKAGNLNYAIKVTKGEFILQLDADHVPLPNILDRMLGHFNDPKMAVVQSPQDFYNVDSFTHIVNDRGRRLWEENRIFYSLIQPGRDNWGASFFCGSCGILRRSALEEIGGFATETIIEDMETTIRLNAAGYKSGYHNETLAYGLSPGAAGAYHVQRLRWGQGAMQILRKLKPLTMRGLTLPQRICYFAGTSTYLEGWQKFVFYTMPILYFFTGILPVGGDENAFLLRLIPYVFLAIVSFELLSRGTGYLFLSERYTMVRFFTYMLAVSALFTTKKLKFNVTPKGHSGVPFGTYAPQLVLLILSISAPIFGTLAYSFGWINYTSTGWGAKAFWVNSIWVVWNCYFAAYVVRHSLAVQQQRDDHRFAEQIPVQVRVVDDTSAAIIPALTADLNPSGLGFRSTQRVEPGSKVSIPLRLASGTVRTTGVVKHVSEEKSNVGAVFMHGVEFSDMPIDVRDAIELHCTQHAMPAWRLRYRQNIDILTRASEVMRNLRNDRRRPVGLPVNVRVEGIDGASTFMATDTESGEGMLILEEISESGARLVGSAPLAPGTKIEFDVPGVTISGKGVVRHVHAMETPMAVLFTMGVELEGKTQRRLLNFFSRNPIPSRSAAA